MASSSENAHRLMSMRALAWRLLVLPMLLALVARRCEAATYASINFAVMWNEEGMATVLDNLFNRIFLPNIRATCPTVPGINDTVFNFIDVPRTGLYDVRAANQRLTDLQSVGALFAGAYDHRELEMFSAAAVPTGVAGYRAMQLHIVAPLTLLMAADGILKALTIAFKLPPSGAVGTKLCIVLGEGYTLDEMQLVLDMYPGSVQFFRLRRGNEQAIINQVKSSGATNFMLASPAEEADYFLATAYDSLLLSPPYRWFLFNVRLVDKNNFAGFKVVSKNITSMEFGPISTAISNNLTRPRDIYAFDMLSIWSIYLQKILCGEPFEGNVTYNGMTGDFLLLSNGTVTRTDWLMYFYGGLGSERERIGNWTYNSGMFNFNPPPSRIANEATIISEIKKNTFRVVTILKPPFVQYKQGMANVTNATLYERLDGFAIDLCKEVLSNMTITDVTFFLQPDDQYGVQDASGNWNGMVLTLMQGKADLACASVSDTDARREVMKFTQAYLSFQLTILYVKKPENPLLFMFQFMRPFHLYTWLAVIGSVVGLSVVLTVLHRLSRNAVVFSLYETIFFSFASLIQGITGTPPDRPSGQLVIAVYWLFAFVILVAYVTNYAATRTLSRLQSDITSLSTLYTQTSYVYGTLSGTSYLSMLQNSTDSTQQQIYRYMTSDPENRIIANLSLAMELVKNGTFALIYDSAMNQYNGQFLCNSVNTGSFSSQSATFGVPKTVEYDVIMDTAITTMINNGRRDSLYKKYFTVSQQLNCRSTQFPDLLRDYIPDEPPIFNTKAGALTLNNTLGIAVINLVGCVLTLLLATVECIYLRCRRWHRRRRLRAEQKRAQLSLVPKLTADLDPMESTA